MAQRKKTMAEKHKLKLAKKDFKLSLKSGNHNAGRHEIIKALADGMAECNFGSIKVHAPLRLKGQV